MRNIKGLSYFAFFIFMLDNYKTDCSPVNMCAGSRERNNVFQMTVSETVEDAIPRLLQKFQLFLRNLGDFIDTLKERGLRGDQHLLEAIGSSEGLDGFPVFNLQNVGEDIDEQLIRDYQVLLNIWPFVEHMKKLEESSDRISYSSVINDIYSYLQDLICEFYTVIVNRDRVIPSLQNPATVPLTYNELSAASRHLYHFLLSRDMQKIVTLLRNGYADN
ncbi:uncharacterized protein LOC133181362 [Saccostrea echinata]|uniref:uncharacterized protein LOC133181362 n=1 Tax=Saccostrea echinata TaxID=191078 RepID=UPI002A80D4D5|nr:uncharacterized protein LOC133181362 [Saccostrea echinata]